MTATLSRMKHGTTGYRQGCRCEACTAAHRDYERERTRRNNETILATRRAWRTKNRSALNAKRRDHYARNQARISKQQKEYYVAHAEEVKERVKAYFQTAAGKKTAAVSQIQRRARRRMAQGVATTSQVQARIDYYGGKCWMCGAPAGEIDHVIPLSKGGSNWPANLRPACRSCNARKNARHPLRTYG